MTIQPSGSARDRLRRAVCLLAVFIAVSLVTRWLSFGVDVLDIDESAHIAGSWELMRGGLLYTTFVDNKPPLLYVYYALAQLIFGRGMSAVHLLTALVTVPFTALAVSAFYRHDARGVVAGLAFLVYSAAFLAHDMLASNAEILMLLPGTWAIVAISTPGRAPNLRRAALAGCLLGIAFLLKYQIVFWLPAVAIATAWTSLRGRRLGAAFASAAVPGLGFVIPLLATWLWFQARGGADALLYWTITNNFSYANNPILVSEAVVRGLGNLLPFLIVTAPLWWAWRRSLGRYDSEVRQILVSTLVIASLLPAFLGFRFFPHYFIQLYPPLAIAAAPWLVAQRQPTPTRAGRLVVAWSLIVLVGFNVANAILYLDHAGVYREGDPVYRKVAAWLRADACAPDATLFVWGYAPMFYYFADLRPASRFVVLAPSRLTGYTPGNLQGARRRLSTEYLIVPRHWDWLMSDLERSRVTYVVDTAPAGIYRWNLYPIDDHPRLREFLSASYDVASTVDRVVIYRRRGCGALN